MDGLPNTEIFQLPPDTDYPQLAFQCCLAGVRPVEPGPWNDKACKVFEQTLLEESGAETFPVSVHATIVIEDNGVVTVELRLGKKDLGELLVAQEVAILEEDFNESVSEDRTAKHGARNLVDEFGDFKHVILETDQDYDVVMEDYDELDRLVFHAQASSEVMDDLTAKIAEEVKGKEGGEGLPEDFKTGPCLAKCPNDDLWYRANVLQIMDDKYQVFDLIVKHAKISPLPNFIET